jgi:two-component system CheB/CheR fusion protein
VITFVNIDTQKAAQEKVAAQSQQFTESIVATVREALLVLDDDMQVLTANKSFYRMFKADPKNTEGQSLFKLGNHQWDIPDLRRLLETVAAEFKTFEDYQMTHDFPGVGRKVMRLNARHLREEDAEKNKILLAIEDVTEKEEG